MDAVLHARLIAPQGWMSFERNAIRTGDAQQPVLMLSSGTEG
jgi:hypothetical protein